MKILYKLFIGVDTILNCFSLICIYIPLVSTLCIFVALGDDNPPGKLKPIQNIDLFYDDIANKLNKPQIRFMTPQEITQELDVEIHNSSALIKQNYNVPNFPQLKDKCREIQLDWDRSRFHHVTIPQASKIHRKQYNNSQSKPSRSNLTSTTTQKSKNLFFKEIGEALNLDISNMSCQEMDKKLEERIKEESRFVRKSSTTQLESEGIRKIKGKIQYLERLHDRLKHYPNSILQDSQANEKIASESFHEDDTDNDLSSLVSYPLDNDKDNRPLVKSASVREFVGNTECKTESSTKNVYEDSSSEPMHKLPAEVELHKRSNDRKGKPSLGFSSIASCPTTSQYTEYTQVHDSNIVKFPISEIATKSETFPKDSSHLSSDSDTLPHTHEMSKDFSKSSELLKGEQIAEFENTRARYEMHSPYYKLTAISSSLKTENTLAQGSSNIKEPCNEGNSTNDINKVSLEQYDNSRSLLSPSNIFSESVVKKNTEPIRGCDITKLPISEIATKSETFPKDSSHLSSDSDTLPHTHEMSRQTDSIKHEVSLKETSIQIDTIKQEMSSLDWSTIPKQEQIPVPTTHPIGEYSVDSSIVRTVIVPPTIEEREIIVEGELLV
ncbi:hypothetical protein [Candidatus Tisiphia endosymbiont of Oplodontha viridula]|uniref:hypothetical protein n=1 Tax=Candidatus Tisiphia endosymbiont of Oplodontha viridula TaxID=3077925 RepID=UPI0035C93E2A